MTGRQRNVVAKRRSRPAGPASRAAATWLSPGQRPDRIKLASPTRRLILDSSALPLAHSCINLHTDLRLRTRDK